MTEREAMLARIEALEAALGSLVDNAEGYDASVVRAAARYLSNYAVRTYASGLSGAYESGLSDRLKKLDTEARAVWRDRLPIEDAAE